MFSYVQNAFCNVKNLTLNALHAVTPTIVGYAIKAGFEDPRIGRIVGGVGLIATGISTMAASGIPKALKSWCWNKTASPMSIQNENAPKQALRLGVAAVGFTATCYGIYNVALGTLELMYPNTNSQQLYLVCHDNKPKHDKKAGYVLPRLGVVEIQTGEYEGVHLEKDSSLTFSEDLESLKLIEGNKYLTCESKGKCYEFSLDKVDEDYSAHVTNQFQLPVPKDRFYNLEGISLEDDKMCWSHRGGIYAGEEPWTRCAPQSNLTQFDEVQVQDPFAIKNKLNRAISDQAVGPISGEKYYIATIDTEGSEGIEATKDQAYSFLYTKDVCLKHFPEDKFEALHINEDETSAIVATDNESRGSKVCQLSLKNGDMQCVDVRNGEQYGIGGIAPIS